MLYNPQPMGQGWEEMKTAIDANWQQLNRIDREAKENNTLLHRYLKEPHADGYAVYQIVKVNQKTVKIKVCYEIGDDWTIPYWGEEATIDREYAEQRVTGRDRMAELFS